MLGEAPRAAAWSCHTPHQRWDVTVIVGPSGSGKSTLLHVLAGLWPPSEGDVLLDGQRTDGAERRSLCSVSFQDPVLRSGSVKDNLLSVEPQLTARRMQALARSTGLDEVLARLPQGWESAVGTGGRDLSGGERLRLGLARALAKPSRLLFIDEPTSALDAEGERAVVATVGRLRGEWTTVVVAHQPAMLSVADHVVVLVAGRVAQAGPPADLLAEPGPLAEMMRRWQATTDWRVK